MMEKEKQELKERESYLEKMIKKIDLSLVDAPNGKLRITSHHGIPKYYIRQNPPDNLRSSRRRHDDILPSGDAG